MSSHSLLQRIFPTQGSNLGLLHCRQILHWATKESHFLFFLAEIKNRVAILILLFIVIGKKLLNTLSESSICHQISLAFSTSGNISKYQAYPILPFGLWLICPRLLKLIEPKLDRCNYLIIFIELLLLSWCYGRHKFE